MYAHIHSIYIYMHYSTEHPGSRYRCGPNLLFRTAPLGKKCKGTHDGRYSTF